MTEATPTKTVEALLAEAQAEWSQPARSESGQIMGRRSYSYTPLGALTEMASKHLAPRGVALTTPCAVEMNEQGNGGTLTCEARLLGPAGDTLAASFPVPLIGAPRRDDDGEPMWDAPRLPVTAQDLGSAQTYARKYAAFALLGVAPAADDDGAEASQQPKARPKPGVRKVKQNSTKKPMRKPMRKPEKKPEKKPEQDDAARLDADWVRKLPPDETAEFYNAVIEDMRGDMTVSPTRKLGVVNAGKAAGHEWDATTATFVTDDA